MWYKLCNMTMRLNLFKHCCTIAPDVQLFAVYSVTNRDWHILSNDKMIFNTTKQISISEPTDHTHIDKHWLGLFIFCHCELRSDGSSICPWCQASRYTHHTRTQMFLENECSPHDWGNRSWKGQGCIVYCIFIIPSAVEIDRFKISWSGMVIITNMAHRRQQTWQNLGKKQFL